MARTQRRTHRPWMFDFFDSAGGPVLETIMIRFWSGLLPTDTGAAPPAQGGGAPAGIRRGVSTCETMVLVRGVF